MGLLSLLTRSSGSSSLSVVQTNSAILIDKGHTDNLLLQHSSVQTNFLFKCYEGRESNKLELPIFLLAFLLVLAILYCAKLPASMQDFSALGTCKK